MNDHILKIAGVYSMHPGVSASRILCIQLSIRRRRYCVLIGYVVNFKICIISLLCFHIICLFGKTYGELFFQIAERRTFLFRLRDIRLDQSECNLSPWANVWRNCLYCPGVIRWIVVCVCETVDANCVILTCFAGDKLRPSGYLCMSRYLYRFSPRTRCIIWSLVQLRW
jgi:hypothetical protein